jgi:hypothetical protein
MGIWMERFTGLVGTISIHTNFTGIAGAKVDRININTNFTRIINTTVALYVEDDEMMILSLLAVWPQ